jgi:hypothetical protein
MLRTRLSVALVLSVVPSASGGNFGHGTWGSWAVTAP